MARRSVRLSVNCGVPQGLVLGPILWITVYDAVLRCPMPPSTGTMCYADDTLVMAEGHCWSKTLRLTETAVACVIRPIHRLGLSVSPAKSEALWYIDHRRRGPLLPD
jgi:hypothetical protein